MSVPILQEHGNGGGPAAIFGLSYIGNVQPDSSSLCAWSEERSDRTASSLDWRVWAGRAASLVRSLRETTCCLSWALAGIAATPNRRAIASIETHTFTRKCILPPIFWLGQE